ncbi:chromo' (CHRromatin Organization MOdifier) domain protein [Ancylostoma caninum]|uniref:Chromo' (CHRromatin Organization MOdifier) domain protein n=1 Tax=Ancylostoma caninum TaxID=29170 RepID=A0A368GPM7_ANCCA|nr:chromo' (CHRromatin Organization MOdifier) domain protein [Ancylostoma caninum]
MAPRVQQQTKKAIFDRCEAYMVEKILKTRKRAGRREFLIKWEGWPLAQSTWEAESDCDCEEAIKEFYETSGSQRDGKGKRRSGVSGKLQSSSQESRGARRATLEEIKGVVPEKKRRTMPKEKSDTGSKGAASLVSAKQQNGVKPEKEPTPKEEKPLSPVKDERNPPSPVKDGTKRSAPIKEERLKSPSTEKGTKRELMHSSTELVYTELALNFTYCLFLADNCAASFAVELRDA